MVDTINALVEWPLSPQIVETLEKDGVCRSHGWLFETARKQDPRTGESYTRISGYHDQRKINVRGKNNIIEWVGASLPRVLFNYNGRLIKDPYELAEAVRRLFLYVEDIATPVQKIIEFTRVDLVLNLPVDPKTMTVIHKNARHPWVRVGEIEYGETGIRFPGGERCFQLYWKQKERADKSGFTLPPLSKSVRAELQLKKKGAVRRVLGGNRDNPVSHLDFFQCYNIFRQAWCMFDKEATISIPDEKCTLHAIIADCEAQGHKTRFGISYWEWFCLNGQKKSTINRIRPLIQAAKQDLNNFKWRRLLPPHWGDAIVVDIDFKGTETVLTDLW